MFKIDLAYENWKNKYRFGNETPLETQERVAGAAAEAERPELREVWKNKFLKTLVNFDKNNEPVGLKCTPGGRITANAGTTFTKATLLNCYIGSPVSGATVSYKRKSKEAGVGYDVSITTSDTPDDLINIFLTIAEQAKTLASEGGYGINFDFIRPRGSLIKGTGIKHPGVVAYMKIWDAVSQCIVQGSDDGYLDKIKNHLSDEKLSDVKKIVKASIRKGAQMAVLSTRHPDCEEFVRAKQDSGVLTKFNMSVLMDDDFMKAVEADDLYDQSFNGKLVKRVKARELYNLIMESCYNRAEPGVLFVDNYHRNNPISFMGKADCTNPCFSGDSYLLTEEGINTFKYYAEIHGKPLSVLQDNRVSFIGRGDSERWSVDVTKSGHRYTPASHAFKTKSATNTVTVGLLGGPDLTVTPDHHLMTFRGAVEAGKLIKGDRVLLCLPEMPESFEYDTLNLAAMLMGFVDATGGTVEGVFGGVVYIDLAEDDKATNTTIRGTLELLWNVYGQEIVAKHPMLPALYCSEGEEAGIYRINSPFLYWLFKYKFGWLGKKQIPMEFLTYARKKSYAMDYISAFISSCGSVNISENACSLIIRQQEESFLKILQAMCWALGVHGNILKSSYCAPVKGSYKGKSNSKKHSCTDSFELNFPQNTFLGLSRIINSMRSDKLDLILANISDGSPSRISSQVTGITKGLTQDVYCIKENDRRIVTVNTVVARRCGEIYGLSSLTTVCLLGSLNLTQYIDLDSNKHAQFDWEKYREDIFVFVRFLDNINDISYNPLPGYDWAMKNLRQIGMGVNGLASAMMMMRLPYNSEEGLEFVEKVCSTKENYAWQASALLAKEKGTFPAYNKKEFESTEYFKSDRITEETKALMRKHGVRNAKVTTQPPLGNSSLVCNNVSNSIEPAFRLEYDRKVMAKTWPVGLSKDNVESVLKHVKEKDYDCWVGEYKGKRYYYEPHNRGLCDVHTIRDYGYSWLLENFPDEDHSAYTITAKDLTIADHLNVQEIVQHYNNQATSKTSNLPKDYPFEDFKGLYLEAWKRKLVGFTTYREGCMESVLSSVQKSAKDSGIVTKDIKLPATFLNGPTTIIKREHKKFYIHFSYLPEDTAMEFPVVLWIYTNVHYKEDLKICNAATRHLAKLALKLGIDKRIVEESLDKCKEDYPHNRLGRMISLNLRHNVPRADILASLMGVEGDNISTLLSAVKKFLGQTLKDGTRLHGIKCPKCKSENLIMQSGCYTCEDCLYSGCGA